MDSVTIYTDGACKGNPGPGGWGALMLFGEHEKHLFGGEAETTNNRMELLAAIEALDALTRPCKVHLITDSVYMKDGITKWIGNWRRKGKEDGRWQAGKEPRFVGTLGPGRGAP